MNNELNITLRKAEIGDLKEIQELNQMLFDLEYDNYDSTIDTAWPVSNDGTQYF